MGYPMTYPRVLSRSSVTKDVGYGYDHPCKGVHPPIDDRCSRAMLAGDLRRLEMDTLDEWHIARYAKHAGCTRAQARKLFEAFFSGELPYFQSLVRLTAPKAKP